MASLVAADSHAGGGSDNEQQQAATSSGGAAAGTADAAAPAALLAEPSSGQPPASRPDEEAQGAAAFGAVAGDPAGNEDRGMGKAEGPAAGLADAGREGVSNESGGESSQQEDESLQHKDESRGEDWRPEQGGGGGSGGGSSGGSRAGKRSAAAAAVADRDGNEAGGGGEGGQQQQQQQDGQPPRKAGRRTLSKRRGAPAAPAESMRLVFEKVLQASDFKQYHTVLLPKQAIDEQWGSPLLEIPLQVKDSNGEQHMWRIRPQQNVNKIKYYLYNCQDFLARFKCKAGDRLQLLQAPSGGYEAVVIPAES